MKKFISNFCLRGLIAMGFGPIVYGCIMLILHLCNVDTTSDGLMIFKGIWWVIKAPFAFFDKGERK